MEPRADVTGLTPNGYWVSKAHLGPERERAIKERLTMTPIDTSGMPGPRGGNGGAAANSFPLWRESAHRLYVPKCFGLREFGPVPDGGARLESGASPLSADGRRFAGSLRAEQLGPIERYLEAARDPARMGGILSLPCGFGKTVAALHILATLGVRAMVVVHKEFLMNQWRERIEQFLPGAKIGTIRGNTIDVEGKDVVLAMLQSLSMKEYDARSFSGIGLLIVDECHRIGTEVFSRALVDRTYRYSLGISATVDRKDGMTKALTHCLGEVLYRGNRRSDDVIVVQQSFQSADPAYCEQPMINVGRGVQKPNISRMINNIAAHRPRTDRVVDAIRAALAGAADAKVLVLSDRKAQLRDVHDQLGPEVAGFYWGGMKREGLAESEAKRVMLATYAYASEGMDVPGLDTLVLASPKSDVQQSVGRILRLEASKRTRMPIVIDVVDQFSLFKQQAAKRAKFYRAHKYTVIADDLAGGLAAARGGA